MKKENNDVLIIELIGNSGYSKIYKISYENFIQQNATYDKKKYPIYFSKEAKYFLEILDNFHNSINEVSFKYYNKLFEIHSQIDGDKEKKTIFRTKLQCSPEDFSEFNSNIDYGKILIQFKAIQTFNIRQLKNYLPYCELALSNVMFHMNKQGNPVKIILTPDYYIM
jgi:hypothetical protein